MQTLISVGIVDCIKLSAILIILEFCSQPVFRFCFTGTRTWEIHFHSRRRLVNCVDPRDAHNFYLGCVFSQHLHKANGHNIFSLRLRRDYYYHYHHLCSRRSSIFYRVSMFLPFSFFPHLEFPVLFYANNSILPSTTSVPVLPAIQPKPSQDQFRKYKKKE